MRIGIFGGTFDPPHVGHLIAASDACDALSLDRVVFIPNALQPLKEGQPQSIPADRLEMIRLAAATDERFAVSDAEVLRGGVSYSVDTLEKMALEDGASERFFLAGADICRSFAQWRSPKRIAELARLAVLWRAGGIETDSPQQIVEALQRVIGTNLPAPIVVNARRIDVSSTEIRDRVKAGRSIAPFVAAPVARFISERGLYR